MNRGTTIMFPPTFGRGIELGVHHLAILDGCPAQSGRSSALVFAR